MRAFCCTLHRPLPGCTRTASFTVLQNKLDLCPQAATGGELALRLFADRGCVGGLWHPVIAGEREFHAPGAHFFSHRLLRGGVLLPHLCPECATGCGGLCNLVRTRHISDYGAGLPGVGSGAGMESVAGPRADCSRGISGERLRPRALISGGRSDLNQPPMCISTCWGHARPLHFAPRMDLVRRRMTISVQTNRQSTFCRARRHTGRR